MIAWPTYKYSGIGVQQLENENHLLIIIILLLVIAAFVVGDSSVRNDVKSSGLLQSGIATSSPVLGH